MVAEDEGHEREGMLIRFIDSHGLSGGDPMNRSMGLRKRPKIILFILAEGAIVQVLADDNALLLQRLLDISRLRVVENKNLSG